MWQLLSDPVAISQVLAAVIALFGTAWLARSGTRRGNIDPFREHVYVLSLEKIIELQAKTIEGLQRQINQLERKLGRAESRARRQKRIQEK